jgi:DNA-binding beta-propeller fold protein YncE
MRQSRILWAAALGVGLTACSTPGAGSGASTTPTRSSIAPSAPSTATATAASTQAVGPVLGCSTAIASAPTLDTVQTFYSSGPIEPFGVAISPDSRTAFVADASGAIYAYSLGSGAPTVENVDSFRVTSTDGIPPQPGVSPLGLASTPNGKYLIAADNNGGQSSSTCPISKRRIPIGRPGALERSKVVAKGPSKRPFRLEAPLYS